MTDDQIRKEVAFLSAASRQELLLRWEQLNGSPAPEGLSTSLLRRGVIYDLQAKHYGGLSPAYRKALLQIAASKTAAHLLRLRAMIERANPSGSGFNGPRTDGG